MKVVDLSHAEQECGAPALELVRRAYAELAVGEELEVSSDVTEHAFAVRAWTQKVGGRIIEDTRSGRRTRIRLRSGAA